MSSPITIRSRWSTRLTLLLLLAGGAAVMTAFAGHLETAVLSISQRYADWLTRLTGSSGWAVLGLPGCFT